MSLKEQILVEKLKFAAKNAGDVALFEFAKYLQSKMSPELLDLVTAVKKYRDFVKEGQT